MLRLLYGTSTNDNNFLLIFYIYISLKTTEIKKLCWFVTTENAKWENNSSELQYLEFGENFRSYIRVMRVKTNKTLNIFLEKLESCELPQKSPPVFIWARQINCNSCQEKEMSQNQPELPGRIILFQNDLTHYDTLWHREIKWLNIPWSNLVRDPTMIELETGKFLIKIFFTSQVMNFISTKT